MKKLISWALLLTMVMVVFAGCGKTEDTPNKDTENDPPATQDPVTPPAPVEKPEDYVSDARAYVLSMYKDKAGKTMRDFKVVSVVSIGDFSYDVVWTTDASEENVKIGAAENGIIVVDVNEEYAGEEDLHFTMTATVKAGDKTESVQLKYFIPGKPVVSGGPAWVEGQPAAGSTYKYALVQAELGKTLYFTGAMSGNYLAASDDVTKAVDVTIEEVDGGFRLFFMDGEVKTYIDINEYAAGKAGVRLTAEPTAVFTWNEECKVFVANVAGADRYLGTYSTYSTFSASDIKYIAGENLSKIGVSQFPAGFCAVTFQVAHIDAPTAGTTAKFYLHQTELGKSLYFNGKMSGNYLASTDNPFAAVDVTIEEVDGGVRFFFMDGEVKTYIDINEYAAGKAGVRLTAEPTAVFTWNEECKVFVANVAGADRYLGTYSTYNTFSASDIKYIAGENVSKIGVSQFPAGFCTPLYNYTPAEGQPAAGAAYKFALNQAEIGKMLYFTGAMSGNYLAASEDASKAVDVTIEEVDGGFRFFFMDGEVKTYIDINEYAAGKAGVRLTAEPTAVFTWNEECKVFVANVAGADRYLGTYSTYSTFSASDIKYIAGENVSKIGVSQFPAGFGFASPAI